MKNAHNASSCQRCQLRKRHTGKPVCAVTVSVHIVLPGQEKLETREEQTVETGWRAARPRGARNDARAISSCNLQAPSTVRNCETREDFGKATTPRCKEPNRCRRGWLRPFTAEMSKVSSAFKRILPMRTAAPSFSQLAFTTPTSAGLTTRPLSENPLCTTESHLRPPAGGRQNLDVMEAVVESTQRGYG